MGLSDRITRLTAQQTAIDAAITNLTIGVEEVQVGGTRYRYSQLASLMRARERIDARLSMLNSLSNCGGRTLVERGGY